MEVVETQSALRPFRHGVFVPTMGALHEGHLSLIRRAVEIAGQRGTPVFRPPVVVSIFVNPTQFGQKEDLARYPRTLDADLDGCAEAGADAVFVPAVEEIYPPGRTAAAPPLPAVATRPLLEDAARPGHFAGVCQVVARLFDLVQPVAAVFGEKDWQQLQVVRAMVRDLKRWPGLMIEQGATVRDADGLAMSSRNRFLSASERERGLALSRALCEADGVRTPAEAEAVLMEVLTRAGVTPDYAVVRDAETLEAGAAPATGRAMRAVVAGRVGSVRLLDNAAWRGSGR